MSSPAIALRAPVHAGVAPLSARRARTTPAGCARGERQVAAALTSTVDPSAAVPSFHAAPGSHFDMANLALKGPRSNVDKGDPHDYGRPFVKGALDGSAACGSWACSPGGWDSPNARPSTEWFYVLSGAGCVTDPDGTPHPFGPGDVVVLPKGWYGRWDITEHIHKIWLTHEHEDKEGASFRPNVKPFAQLRSAVVSSADGRSGVASYDATGFRAGAWSLPAHGKAYVDIEPNAIELFVLQKGELFVVDADGAVARRCVAGDVVFLPQSWRGTLRGGDAAAEAAAVSVANGTSVSVVSAGIPNVAVSSLGNSAERDEMYDPENESRGRR
jgi:uncharacterized cupin superfamily protein